MATGTLRDLLASGMTPEEINALLSQSNVSTAGFDPMGATGRGEPYMPSPQGYGSPGMVEQAPLNMIRNNSTGRTFAPTDMYGQPSQSAAAGPITDPTRGYVDTPAGRGMYMKADPLKVVLQNGQIVDLGRDTGAERARMKENLAMDKVRADIAHTQAQTEGANAKPVAVYGADGKTPEFVLPKDAIGRKPYVASVAGQGEFTPEALRTIAEQYLAGDRQAAQGYARNAAAKMAIANEITKVATEKGMAGADIAAVMADYSGMVAGARTLGTRTANVKLAAGEAASMIPLALDASRKVERSGFLPFGKAQVMFDDQTNVPELRQFAAANLALVNTYARAISPTGVPTQADKEHARQVLSLAHDQKSYEATVMQMQKEMDAALAAPQRVRGEMKQEISGREAPAAAAAPTAPARVATVNDAMKLPSGTKFIDPNGVLRVRP